MPGPAVAVGAHGGVHQRLGHAVALDDALAGEAPDALVVGRGQCRRAGDQQPSAAQRADDLGVGLGVRDQAVVHRRDAEEHRGRTGELGGRRLRAEAPEVVQRAAEAQRAEHAEDQPVDVEQRQPVGEHVRRRSTPTPRRARRGSTAIARRGSTTPFGGPVVPDV